MQFSHFLCRSFQFVVCRQYSKSLVSPVRDDDTVSSGESLTHWHIISRHYQPDLQSRDSVSQWEVEEVTAPDELHWPPETWRAPAGRLYWHLDTDTTMWRLYWHLDTDTTMWRLYWHLDTDTTMWRLYWHLDTDTTKWRKLKYKMQQCKIMTEDWGQSGRTPSSGLP